MFSCWMRPYPRFLYESSGNFFFKLNSAFLTLSSIPIRYFKANDSLLNDFKSSYNCEASVPERKAKKHGKLIKQNGCEGSVSLSTHRKFAEESNAKLIKSGGNSTELSTLKFGVTGKFPDGRKKDKTEKKFRMRDVIGEQDLQVKINLILKYVEKGRNVLCEITTANEKNQFKEVLEKLNNSKLKDYHVSTNKFKNRACVTYKKNVLNKEPGKGEDNEIVKSS